MGSWEWYLLSLQVSLGAAEPFFGAQLSFQGGKKKKKPQQLRIPEGDAGVKSQRAHRDLFQSVVQGTMSPPGGPLGYRADSVASKPDLLALLTSEPGSEWRL